MKKINKLIVVVLAVVLASSCEDYLDRPKQAELPVEDVFKDFVHAQGFIEVMYRYVVNYSNSGNQNDGSNFLMGDEAVSNTTMLPGRFDAGAFWHAVPNGSGYLDRPDAPSNIPAWEQNNATIRPGIWDGWRAIRIANIVLANMDLMVGATQTEKNLIRGQALFFRAFFHSEIMKFWGRIPYIDFVVTGNDGDFKLPRPATYKECAMKADADYAAAAELLPYSWDDLKNDPNAQMYTFKTETYGNNLMRINKAIVYSFKGKNLLFAASPLMKNSTSATPPDTYDYDQELCEMAASDFARVIQMDRDNVNNLGLANKNNYTKLFYTNTTNVTKWPGTASYMGGEGEYIFSSTAIGINFATALPKSCLPYAEASAANSPRPTHNFIHQTFGTANGLACDEDLSFSPQNEFLNRDPRFYLNLVIDGDTLIRKEGASADRKYAQLYTTGFARLRQNNAAYETGYFIKKWSDVSFNTQGGVISGDFDGVTSFNSFRMNMRLTDVYLMYAEALAATEKYGVDKAPNFAHLPSAPSAIEVINLIRSRFDVPTVQAAYSSIGIDILGNRPKFIDVVRRERSIELAFEGQRWDDIRRWVIAHKPEYKTKTALEFDRNVYTNVSRASGAFQNINFKVKTVRERICDYPKHFWVPFAIKQTELYQGFDQNPGW
jgi:hypothetical protein